MVDRTEEVDIYMDPY